MSKGVLLDQYGHPLRANGHAQAMHDLIARLQPPRRTTAELSYDAAGESTRLSNYWARADKLDADSANSKTIRGKLTSRSRYEAGSNPYYDGLLNTFANYLLGKTGPKLRLQSSTPGFNQAVETVWSSWAQAIQFRRKLWCMGRMKPSDGESLGIAVNNPGVRHRIKLDIRLIETEQCTTPNPAYSADGFIDGITPDEHGNPAIYHILASHPGSSTPTIIDDVIDVPAQFVLHWFQLARGGQHRGVPEFKSSMNTGATSRRFREATVDAAESASRINVLLETLFPPEEVQTLTPFTTAALQESTIMALPAGFGAHQMKGEHPTAQYGEFIQSQLTELGRPKSVPRNLTACDSSDSTFASGKLDREAFYAELDVCREDGNDTVLDTLFPIWWKEAVLEYGWNADPDQPPLRYWDWPRYPIADVVAEADAIDKDLRNGRTYLSKVYSDEGRDFDDELPKMAADYGVTPDEMRAILRTSLFNSMNQQAAMLTAETQAKVAAKAAAAPPPPAPVEVAADA